jgi:hypothetical protein
MQSYVIGSLPPTIAVSTLNSNVFRIRINNVDENYSLTLSDIAITAQVIQSSGFEIMTQCKPVEQMVLLQQQ